MITAAAIASRLNVPVSYLSAHRILLSYARAQLITGTFSKEAIAEAYYTGWLKHCSLSFIRRDYMTQNLVQKTMERISHVATVSGLGEVSFTAGQCPEVVITFGGRLATDDLVVKTLAEMVKMGLDGFYVFEKVIVVPFYTSLECLAVLSKYIPTAQVIAFTNCWRDPLLSEVRMILALLRKDQCWENYLKLEVTHG
jgi:hypothetical protein